MAKLLSVCGKNAKLALFNPEQWGEVRTFHEFYRQTHRLKKRARAALLGIQSHFRRAEFLRSVIKAQSVRIERDREQEEKAGYSTHSVGEQMAGLIESFACELYSSVDCANQVVRAVFPKAQGIGERTSVTFKNAKAGKLEKGLPKLIQRAFGSAAWYEELRSIRTTATHSDTGLCRLNQKTGFIEYYVNCDFHSGNSLHLDNVLDAADGFSRSVNQFHGSIFRALNATLNDDEQQVICLIANGRFYHRWVRPSEAKDFDLGRCESFTWFDSSDSPVCPRANDCGAYLAAKKLTRQ